MMLSLTSRAQAATRSREDSHALVPTLVAMSLLCLTTLALLAAPVPSGKPGNYPAWWFSRGVIPQTTPTNSSPSWPTNYPTANDYAVINEGQLKNLATQAYNELVSKAPTNVWTTPAGTNLTTLVTGWSNTGNNYTAINLGQLKTVAKPFYDVLIGINYTGTYPWTGVGANDYAAANLGQAKYAFSFDLTAAPLAVTGLTTTAAVNEIDLGWTNPPYNPVANLTVLQSTDGGVTWTTVATLASSATSFAATNLDPNLSYSFKISANRTTGGSTATGSTPPAPPVSLPRYALIDLGTNITPAAINNSNVVVGYDSSITVPLMWSGGTNTTLSTSGLSSGGYVTGIDDSGHMVGSKSYGPGVYWSGPTATPSTLTGTVTLPPPYMPPNNTCAINNPVPATALQAGDVCIGGDGSIICACEANSSGRLDAIITATYSPGPVSFLNFAWPASKARGHWAGNCYTNYPSNAVVDGTPYNNKYVSAVNDSGVAVGSDSAYTTALIITGATGTLGPGYAYGLNNATVTSGTNVVPQPQIIGTDASGNPTLWDHTNPDGTPSSSYIAKKINALCPTNSGWTLTSVVAINNSSSIAGTATASGTNPSITVGTTTYSSTSIPPAAGSHGVLLIPLQLRLLNGSTPDFDGSIPANFISAPENPSYANVTNATGGVTMLGVPPMGQGRIDFPNMAYQGAIMVAAKAPASMPGLQYHWRRFISSRSWYIKMSSDGKSCNVTWRNSLGISSPSDDMLDDNVFENVIPSSGKKEFYACDSSGLAYGAVSNDTVAGFMNVGDFIHQEKAFIYIVQTSFDGTHWTDGVTMNIAQPITIKYKATGGTAVTDWLGVPTLAAGNTNTQGNIVPTITVDKVKAIVGSNVSVTIASDANTH